MTQNEQNRRTYGDLHEVQTAYMFNLPKSLFYAELAAFAVGIVVMMCGFFLTGAVILAVVVTAFLPMHVRTPSGRTGYEAASELIGWRRQVRSGAHIYKAGTLSNQAGGRARMPGVGAVMEMWWGIDKLGRRFGMIHRFKAGQYTFWLRCSPAGLSGVEQDRVDQDVSNWGEFTNVMGQAGDVDAVVTVIDTVPETGTRQNAELTRLTHPDAPDPARDYLDAFRADGTRTEIRVHYWMAITITPRSKAKREDPMLMIADLAERIPAVCANLADVRVVAEPLSDHAVAATVRRCYDPRPAVEAAAEDVLRTGEDYVAWSDAGPITAEETKKSYFHDGAVSRTWVMNTPPAGVFTEKILARALEGRADVPRKRVTIIHRPLAPGDGAVAVENTYLAASNAVSSSRGVASVRAQMAAQAADRARAGEAAGAGVTRVSMLLTITADTEADLEQMSDAVTEMGARTHMSLRPAWRQQAAAYLAGLGVGVLLPDHASTAKTLQA